MVAVASKITSEHAAETLPMVIPEVAQVQPEEARRPRRGRGKSRRQSHGAAWHWKQTDAWYYTLPGTRRRVPLFDEDGNRIRGLENKADAQRAMARVKLGQGWRPEAPPAAAEEWIVAKVCSEYIQYCQRGLAKRTLSAGHTKNVVLLLNDLCAYCGALPVSQLKKGHVKSWMAMTGGSLRQLSGTSSPSCSPRSITLRRTTMFPTRSRD